jgi:hypothetical protein
MTRRKKESVDLPEDLAMLDELISQCYGELLKSVKENAKLGDFIKMIELRRKLAPKDADQRKFWSMLERIREETLAKTKGNAASEDRGNRARK